MRCLRLIFTAHARNVSTRIGTMLATSRSAASAFRSTTMLAARDKKNVEHFFAEAANYVQRAAEIVRSASHDRFHWRSLQSTVLPAEPEAVAITTAMSMMSHAMFQRSISDMPNLDAHGRLLVEVGEGMQGAARDRAG